MVNCRVLPILSASINTLNNIDYKIIYKYILIHTNTYNAYKKHKQWK